MTDVQQLGNMSCIVITDIPLKPQHLILPFNKMNREQNTKKRKCFPKRKRNFRVNWPRACTGPKKQQKHHVPSEIYL